MTISHEERAVLAGLVLILTAASLTGFILSKRGRAVDNLNARVRSWWVMVALLAGAILAGRNAVIVLFALLSAGALREFVQVAPRGVPFASHFLVLPVQYALVWSGSTALYSLFIPAYGFLILPIAARRTGCITQTQWGLILCVYCISFAPAVVTRSALPLAFLLLVAQSSDVLQYVLGKLFGRHKIAPRISPGKTVEGFAGGVAGACVIGAALAPITPFNRGQAAGVALIIALAGFLGGLTLSSIKRKRGIKDWGRLIEGHGGILDRLDSICFSAPVFFWLTRYFFTP